MNCYQAKAGELAKHWYVIDATDMVVGRLAAQIAPILMGKHRPTYTPHIDTGDYVIVTNVDKVVFTGNKWQQKFYQRYSGHPGGQKEEQAWKLFKRRPERILWLAVQRMMPKNKIGRHMLAKLKLYVGPQHPHQAQAPTPLTARSGRPASAGAVYVPRDVAPKPRTNGAPRVTATIQPEASLPAPPVEESLPAPPVEASLPAPPVEESLPAPPVEASLPPPPEEESLPAPPVETPPPVPPTETRLPTEHSPVPQTEPAPLAPAPVPPDEPTGPDAPHPGSE